MNADIWILWKSAKTYRNFPSSLTRLVGSKISEVSVLVEWAGQISSSWNIIYSFSLNSCFAFPRSSSVHFGSGASSVRLCQGFISHCSIWSEDCSLGNHANAGPGRETWKNRFVHFCHILVFIEQNGNLTISKFALCWSVFSTFGNYNFEVCI